MTPRIRWIDVARGLGILLVIYAHTLSADNLRYIFYSFHMPLFFFLSGIVFHHRKNEHFLLMVKKNIRTILRPYLIFALLSYVLWYFTIASYTPTLPEVKEHLLGILYGNNGENIMFYNGVLWFLPCLFATKVLFSSFTKLSTKKRFLLTFLFFCSLAGYGISIAFPKDKLIFGLETALTAVVFFGFGNIWNTQSQKLQAVFKKHATLLFSLLILSCLFFSTIHYIQTGYQVDMRLNKLGNYAFFYVASLSGIFSIIALSMALQKNTILEYIGRKSLILFVWHLLIFSYLNIYLLPRIDSQILQTVGKPTLSILTTLFSVAVILSLDILYLKGKKALQERYGKEKSTTTFQQN